VTSSGWLKDTSTLSSTPYEMKLAVDLWYSSSSIFKMNFGALIIKHSSAYSLQMLRHLFYDRKKENIIIFMASSRT
jgi:hypothetical protein